MTSSSSPALCPRNTTILGRVRVNCANADAVSAEHRVRALLGATTVRAEGLPDSAILCVRRWRGRLPRPGEAPKWERDLASSLGASARQAARPAFELVPAEAPAILFRDEAELLACLTLDWMAGTLGEHWWWPALLNGRDPVAFLSKAWLEQSVLVPAAIEMLAARSQAVAFVRQLGSSMAREISCRMFHAFGVDLPLLERCGAGLPEGKERSETVSAPLLRAPAQGYAAPWGLPNSAEAPWLVAVPEIHDSGLAVEGELLIGCALLLRRAPAVARSASFPSKLERWYKSVTRGVTQQSRTSDQPAASERIVAAESYERPLALHETRQEAVASESPSVGLSVPPSPQNAVGTTQEDRTEKRPTQSRQLRETAVEPAHSTDAAAPASPHEESAMPTRLAEAEPSAHPAAAPVVEEAAFELREVGSTEPATTREQPAEYKETAFAGVFFLVNVALFLEYYSDFTSPVARGLELNIWDFVAILGLEFCPADEFRRDPIWKVLAALAGRREHEAPGHSFDPPDETRETWIRRTAATVRDRLDDAMNRNDAVELLCNRAGRVALTSVHVDIHFSLESHPIEIRFAGLDRNPGWIPAAGHYVHYHFD